MEPRAGGERSCWPAKRGRSPSQHHTPTISSIPYRRGAFPDGFRLKKKSRSNSKIDGSERRLGVCRRDHPDRTSHVYLYFLRMCFFFHFTLMQTRLCVCVFCHSLGERDGRWKTVEKFGEREGGNARCVKCASLLSVGNCTSFAKLRDTL